MSRIYFRRQPRHTPAEVPQCSRLDRHGLDQPPLPRNPLGHNPHCITIRALHLGN
jgi:hypothetical protein